MEKEKNECLKSKAKLKDIFFRIAGSTPGVSRSGNPKVARLRQMMGETSERDPLDESICSVI